MTYRAPVADIAFALKHAAGFGPALADGLYGDLSEDVVEAVLGEAGKFATDIIAPLNTRRRSHGTPFKDGTVTTPPGWKDAYRAWWQAGWNGLAGPAQWGGQALPHAVNAACIEMWNSAAMAFGLGPLLTMAGIEALAQHGSDELKRAYLPKLVSGEWMGTMQLTEPQAGSDRRRAAHQGRARSRRQLSHHRAEDLHHLWRARSHRQHHSFRAGAAAGCAGGNQGHLALSCAEIPARRRRLARGAQRRARAFDRAQARHPRLADLHHGLWRQRRRHRFPRRRGEPRHGLHVHHDEPRPAGGRPAGRRHRRARDPAGAGLRARAQAGPRRRCAIRRKPDHRASRRQAHAAHHAGADARRACDLLHHGRRARPRASRADERRAEAAHERASLLTPVAKAFSTDIGNEVASLGVQVHGGMGFIEETGAAQHFRDARILPIYEGTNGIQAIDLVTRKLPLSGGAAVGRDRRDRARSRRCKAANDPAFGCDRRFACRRGRQPGARDDWLLGSGATRTGHGAGRRDALSAAVRASRRAARCWRTRRWRRADFRRRADRRRRASPSRASLPKISRSRPWASSAP